MAAPAILDKLQKIPTKTRAIAFFAIIGVAVVLLLWQVSCATWAINRAPCPCSHMPCSKPGNAAAEES